ncbi:MAG TPA: SAM-dependent methyltransferase [Thermoanaerobaculia bacterium]|nr:SAM-dependent methyltransferase [Thermoanaerobaculia bacterium]
MNQAEPLIRNVSDTALWSAVYRAAETERPDALFRDPYARRLAGERGRQIAESVPAAIRLDWPWVGRTYLFDQLIVEHLAQGADMVVNLAAGLDARPYRMDLPPALQWIEVDLPGILDYKEEILAGEQPRCALERVRLDLSDGAARRDLFARLGSRSHKALILTEGLLIYLTRDEVASLARDLAAPPPFKSWILDLASPGLVRLLQKNIGPQLTRASATLQFGPPEGPAFFELHGWKPVKVLSPIKTAARFHRLSFGMRLFALLPQPEGRQGSRPWSGICLLEKTG